MAASLSGRGSSRGTAAAGPRFARMGPDECRDARPARAAAGPRRRRRGPRLRLARRAQRLRAAPVRRAGAARRARARCGCCTSPTCTWCPGQRARSSGCAASPRSTRTSSSTPATTSPHLRRRAGRCCDAMEPLLELPGVFVLGSNDYFAPTPKNPRATSPATTPRRAHDGLRRCPSRTCVAGLRDGGWVDLTNARATLTVARPATSSSSASTTRTSATTGYAASPDRPPPTPR